MAAVDPGWSRRVQAGGLMADRLVVNQAALHKLLRSPDGPVARDLARRAIRVESQAKRNASGRPGPIVRSGRLRSSGLYDHSSLGP